MSMKAELVGGSRDGTVIVLEGWEHEGVQYQWAPDSNPEEYEGETTTLERYVMTGKSTAAGHAEALFIAIDQVPVVGSEPTE